MENNFTPIKNNADTNQSTLAPNHQGDLGGSEGETITSIINWEKDLAGEKLAWSTKVVYRTFLRKFVENVGSTNTDAFSTRKVRKVWNFMQRGQSQQRVL